MCLAQEQQKKMEMEARKEEGERLYKEAISKQPSDESLLKKAALLGNADPARDISEYLFDKLSSPFYTDKFGISLYKLGLPH